MEDLVIDSRTEAAGHVRASERPAKVLVTGADGYIGTVLAPRLVEAGFDVAGLDTGFYRAGWLFDDRRDRPRVMTRDIRGLRPDHLRGYDAIVHLAELSNDPLCEFDEELTVAINHGASVALAEAAKAAGVRRFVYASSCSVYGIGDGAEAVDESSETHPQTAYARCKLMVERDVGAMASDGFSPTFLRLATAFGASPRQRFDVVLNNLAGLAWTTRKISMTSDGTPWRPLVHIQDIADAFCAALEAPRETVHGEKINVGDDRHNYRIREIAASAAEIFPDCAVEFGRNDGDNRSYRVSFAKIRKVLPSFRARWSAERGLLQMRHVFERIQMGSDTFNAAPFTRLRQLRHLLSTGQVDRDLYWRPHDLH